MTQLRSLPPPGIDDDDTEVRTPSDHASAALQKLGGGFVDVAVRVGGMGILLAKIFKHVLTLDVDRDELLRQMYRMGVKSVPIVFVTALFVGAIMVIQAAPLVTRYGIHGLVGWAAGFSTLREIGPVLTALMISGRVGANNSAELGTMAVTEQLDALRILAISPVNFLLAPRFTALVLTMFLATVFSDVLALIGAAATSYVLLDVQPLTFYHGFSGGLLTMSDVWHGLAKSIAFGAVVGIASCQFGVSTRGGASDVGRSVNATVVFSAVGIFALDYLVSFMLPTVG